MKISLRYISEQLNISKSTVSKILSGLGPEKGFSPATIKMVKEYAKSVGYNPNHLARSLASGASKTIGLIVPAIGDFFYSEMIGHVEKSLDKQGYKLLVCSTEGDEVKENTLVRTLWARQVDGLIIAPVSTCDLSFVNDMTRYSYPFVLIDRLYNDIDVSSVTINNKVSSDVLVSSLIEKGSRKIAIIGADMHLSVMQDRKEGYREALLRANLMPNENLCIELERATYKTFLPRKIAQLLREHPDIDGFFFATHYLAFDTLRYFISKRINYNKRFNLGCFHITDALDILAPEMKFSMMPIKKMSEAAVKFVIRNIDNNAEKKRTRMQKIVLENVLK